MKLSKKQFKKVCQAITDALTANEISLPVETIVQSRDFEQWPNIVSTLKFDQSLTESSQELIRTIIEENLDLHTKLKRYEDFLTELKNA